MSMNPSNNLVDAAKALVEAAEAQPSCDDKLKNIEQKIMAVDKRLAELHDIKRQEVDIMRRDSKRRQIEFALKNTESGAFHYYDQGETLVNSTELVSNILWNFLGGDGTYLPDKASKLSKHYSSNIEESQQDFRDDVVRQLFRILGTQPKLKFEADGQWSIWYE